MTFDYYISDLYLQYYIKIVFFTSVINIFNIISLISPSHTTSVINILDIT